MSPIKLKEGHIEHACKQIFCLTYILNLLGGNERSTHLFSEGDYVAHQLKGIEAKNNMHLTVLLHRLVICIYFYTYPSQNLNIELKYE